MPLKENKGVRYVYFKNLEDTGIVHHGFSTIVGGVSTGIYESMNLAFKNGDLKENVEKNYELLAEAIGFKIKDMVYSSQIHDVKVATVDETNRGNGFIFESTIKDTDGLITNSKNVVLKTFHADCVPIFFLDPVNRAIGLAHSGWRGTVNSIAKVTLLRMMKEFSSKPENMLVGIGPSISKEAFEVDLPVVNEFKEKLLFSEKFIFRNPYKKDKYNIDLWNINKEILTDLGVKAENIEISGYCTFKDSELFYSHRRQGPERGSMAGFLELNY